MKNVALGVSFQKLLLQEFCKPGDEGSIKKKVGSDRNKVKDLILGCNLVWGEFSVNLGLKPGQTLFITSCWLVSNNFVICFLGIGILNCFFAIAFLKCLSENP